MIIVPLLSVPRQTLSILLEGELYQIAVKDCNGVVAVSISTDSGTLVEGRRAVPYVPIIPQGPRERGNFLFTSLNDELPDTDAFGAACQLVYVTVAELAELRA